MSALSAIEAPVLTGTVVAGAGTDERRQHQGLRLVAPPATGRARVRPLATDEPRASSIGEQQARRRTDQVPVRLTRRGRIVLAALAVVGATAVVLLVSLLASGGAQASNHGQLGGAYQGMHQMVVQPGQTLWSIASAAEPTVDPRTVIQQIMTVNALSAPDIQAGQLLWVPRPAG